MNEIARILPIGLLALSTLIACEDDPVRPGHGHEEAEGVVVSAGATELVRYTDDAGATPDTLVLQSGTATAVTVSFLDHDGQAIMLPIAGDEEEQYSIDMLFAPLANVTWAEGAIGSGTGTLTAGAAGDTNVTIQLLHGDHADWQSVAIPVRVE